MFLFKDILSSCGDLSFFNLRKWPQRTTYVSIMKAALRQASEVNAFLRRMGENAWGHRTDVSIVVLKFNEVMAEENAKIEQTDEAGVFLYIVFQVWTSQ